METDDNTAEQNIKAHGQRKYDFHLWPVPSDGSGEGLPYAPADWPHPGDIWGWRVGKRVTLTSSYLDRYLYLPKRLCKLEFGGTCKKFGFKSKLSVERYIRTTFPSADVAAFFASFSWRIPAKVEPFGNPCGNGNEVTMTHIPELLEEKSEQSVLELLSDGEACGAGNRKCHSLLPNAENPHSAPLPCDLCCMEPLFCRDCCCILCYKVIDLNYDGYSYIKCEAVVDDGYMCGHISHIHCALRSYMAGTVGGSIGLDAEYHCRRCDARTDLVPHARRLLQTCESVKSREDIEKILNVGICLLRGSEKGAAMELLNRIEVAIIKLKCETPLEDVWKVDSGESAICSGVSSDDDEMEYAYHENPLGFMTGPPSVLSISSEYQSEYLKLVHEIDEVLQALRKSQELEYKIAEGKLHGQKNFLRVLFQQLDKERSEVSSCKAQGTDADNLLNAVLDRAGQIKREVNKLKEMEQVAVGFGMTPKAILREHFELVIDD